jgi:hypothetical protein
MRRCEQPRQRIPGDRLGGALHDGSGYCVPAMPATPSRRPSTRSRTASSLAMKAEETIACIEERFD